MQLRRYISAIPYMKDGFSLGRSSKVFNMMVKKLHENSPLTNFEDLTFFDIEAVRRVQTFPS